MSKPIRNRQGEGVLVDYTLMDKIRNLKLKVFWPVCRYYGPAVQMVSQYFQRFGGDFVTFVDDYLDCDIAVLLTIGEPDRPNLVAPQEEIFSDEINAILDLAEMGRFSVVSMPLCNVNDGEFYTRLFGTSVLTSSYLNLPDYADVEYRNFVRAPIGVDPNFFYEEDMPRDFLIYTFGYDQKTESFDKVHEAVVKFNEKTKPKNPFKMLHSGRDFGYDSDCYQFIPPAALGDFDAVRKRYCSAKFVSALREDAADEGGFELANLEGPLCGATAITYDLECFSHWFGGMSELVSLDNTVDDLVSVFESRFKALPKDLEQGVIDTKSKIYKDFTWHKVVHRFWLEVMRSVNN